ncbi:MAG: serine/threonine protein kinase [Oscillochloris sp.]|nr:serine/threonine protein kinase [Oscillochloris sp.]
MLVLESTLHDHYRITSLIDERPDCVIYRAIDLRLSMRVLVAELPQLSELAVADVHALAAQITSVNTPGLLNLRDHFVVDATYYLVADDPSGQDLDRVARDRGGPLPEAEVLTLMDRLLSVLDVLHERTPPLLLGELRSMDLWSSPDGGLSLAPFALVRHVGSEPSSYRAPELHDAQTEPSTSSDLYAMGAVLYHLLTGWPPPTAAQREAGIPLNALRTLNARISTLAEQLTLRALEQKPANRYQRAREMRSALETVRLMAGRSLGAMAPVELPVVPPISGPPAQSPVAELASPPARPVEANTVYGPPPAASPYGQPVPGTYVSQPQYASGYTQAPPQAALPKPVSQMRNGCLIGIVAMLALITLMICFMGAFIGYRIFTGAGLPLLNGSALMGLSATPGNAVQSTNLPADQPAPTAGGTAATAAYTQTQRIQEDDLGPLVYAPNGQLMALGIGKTIQLRLGDGLDQGPILSGHTGTVDVVAFSPDSLALASGARDENSVILWDMVTGQELRRFDGHTGWIRSLAFSPNGSILASGSTDNTVRLWDVESGHLLHTLAGHSDYLGNIAFSPDGTTLVSASRDGTVRLWDVNSGQALTGFSYTAPINPETNAPYWLTGIAYNPDGKSIAVGSVNARIYVLDAASGKLQRELKGHTDWVVIRGLSYSPDGRTLASASLDGTVRLWSPLTGTERAMLDDHQVRLMGLSWAPNSQYLAVTSDISGSLTVWDTISRNVVRSFMITQGAVTALAYSDSGGVLGTGSASGTVRLHNFSSGRFVSLPGGAKTSQSVGFVSDTQLVAISDAGEVVIIDLNGQDRNRQLQGLSGLAVSLAVSRDRSMVAAGADNGEVAIWDASSQQLLRTLHGLDGTAVALAFSRNGAQIAAVGNQNAKESQIRAWDVQSGDERMSANSRSFITSMDMSAGGDLVATASNDGSLTIWRVADGTAVTTLSVPVDDHWFSSLAFSPDGNLLVTGSAVGTVDFWDPQSGTKLNSIRLGAGTVLAVAFRPDGKQIAVSTRDKGIYLFEPMK